MQPSTIVPSPNPVKVRVKTLGEESGGNKIAIVGKGRWLVSSWRSRLEIATTQAWSAETWRNPRALEIGGIRLLCRQAAGRDRLKSFRKHPDPSWPMCSGICTPSLPAEGHQFIFRLSPGEIKIWGLWVAGTEGITENGTSCKRQGESFSLCPRVLFPAWLQEHGQKPPRQGD